ncbi:G2/mitotic-specific cyclin-B3 [Elysia marginata]|uniref:G2/mitotic-specific cyclin-B3 n=1 Tax=Elysia marginata TaxID=1093978 RepID=A0AAV4FZR4_9GAST|nr:G2/mitotic-specific cyclin-B3 [Elysia marginata]
MFSKKPTGRNVGPKKVEQPAKGANAKLPVIRPARRAAFGDITNATKDQSIKDGKKKIIADPLKPKTRSNIPVSKEQQAAHIVLKKEKEGKVKHLHDPALLNESEQIISSQESNASERREEEFSFIEGDELNASTAAGERSLLSFDEENKDDVFHVSVYAQDIFDYYKRRERMFRIPPYIGTKQCHITANMRAILVNWLVELQENFELNHETLYLAVKLTDMYMSRVRVDKELLQLLGSAAVFIASKFDERCPPLIEDFTYICDNLFDRNQFIEMEMEVLKKVDFDLGIPISYRFLRRYAKVARLSMETLTLARYILELSLMEYDLITEFDSMIAAAALYIAMRMRSEGAWEGDVVKTSGYELDQIKPLVPKLNAMLHGVKESKLQTVFCKYSHIVFHEVAKIKPLKTSDLL